MKWLTPHQQASGMIFIVIMLVMAFVLAACGTKRAVCGPNDTVIRYTVEQINAMSDEQVTRNLARNLELERLGCAMPNK